MSEPSEPRPFTVPVGDGAVRLSGEAVGDGRPIVLLHGLSATRWYVVLGSKLLARAGHRVISYDARGHGASSPAPDRAYDYAGLVSDLGAVLDGQEVAGAVLVGNSMGAHTALAYALEHPDQVDGLVLVTPAYPGHANEDADDLAAWDRLAAGLRDGGVDGFLEAYDPPVDDAYRDTVMRFTRQRLERHEHPAAVADALEVVPRSVPFDGLERLAELDLPALVVGSRDEADPGHPLAVAQEYAERLPDAELVVEDEGKSPLAWQGAQLSKAIARFVDDRLGPYS